MTWLVVLNPAAGTKGQSAERLRPMLDAEPIEYSLVTTKTADDVRTVVDEAIAAGTRKFAAVGGDGTLHVLVNAVMAHLWPTRPTLALLPAGSGTDLIRTFALPRTLEASVESLASGEPYTMDLGLIELSDGNRRWFINVVDIGVAAAAVTTAARIPRRIGRVRYPIAFWLTLPRFRPAPVEVRTDKRVVRQEALNIVVANGQFFGGGMNIAPQAAISDGLLDVEVFAGPRRNAFAVMPRVIRGLHLRHKAVRSLRAERFVIDVPQSWPIEADGDLIGRGPLTVSAVPAAIDLMI